MVDIKLVQVQRGSLPIAARKKTALEVEKRLSESGLSLIEAIQDRELYFRISVIGACNLNCDFCHNEGGPKKGAIDPEIAENAIMAAVAVGFKRIQFTGGEPLLRKDISDFVLRAKRHVDDVGLTTNGTYLMRELDKLIDAGVTRIHVSLQTESLIEAGSDTSWGIPDWLEPAIECANTGAFVLRLNLPVPAQNLRQTEDFLNLMAAHRCDVKVFSVLPEGEISEKTYPLDQLQALVDRVNASRKQNSIGGDVLLRGFRPPAGVRCQTCAERERCKEQSHSLRLGTDLSLRPCLASRAWDIPLRLDDDCETLTEAALLALDY